MGSEGIDKAVIALAGPECDRRLGVDDAEERQADHDTAEAALGGDVEALESAARQATVAVEERWGVLERVAAGLRQHVDAATPDRHGRFRLGGDVLAAIMGDAVATDDESGR